MPSPDPPDPYAALREPNYRLFASGFVLSSTALQMMAMALGWELYERTKDPLILGLVGVARALPVVLTALPAGQIIDTFPRRRVLALTLTGFAFAAGALAWASFSVAPVWQMLALVAAAGFIRTFNGPARSSLLPDIVPDPVFPNSVTWNSGVFQFSAVAGPIIAGAIIAWSGAAWPVYALTGVLCLLAAGFATRIRPLREPPPGPVSLAGAWRGMGSGLTHLRKEKLILSTITLDLFAVLLGGATGLLPVYASDILHVGPIGLGWLRASAYLGAFAMAIVLLHRPLVRAVGPMLLGSVAAFGACMIVFGISTSFWLSMVVLFVSGAVDNISVVIRHVLVQVRTPQALRGRVSAVNSVFIECSNELGSFESGLVAKFFGPVFSVVSGGIGTLLVVAGVAMAWPQLRRLDRLEKTFNTEDTESTERMK